MKLIIIYGPPAVGKLTVSKELAKMTGYRNFQNHGLVNSVSEVFPFDNKDLKPVLRKLSRNFRLDIYEEAAKNGVNLITTFQGGGSKKNEYLEEATKRVKKWRGEVLLIQLVASKEKLFERVKSKSRLGVKIDSAEMLKNELNVNPNLFDKFIQTEHLTIDNTKLEPKETARMIATHYKLDKT